MGFSVAERESIPIRNHPSEIFQVMLDRANVAVYSILRNK